MRPDETPPGQGGAATNVGDFAEFADLLSDLGAVPVEAPANAETAPDAFDLKDVTILELQKALALLQPLGERLAESEKRRLELEAALAEAERASVATSERSRESVRALGEELRGEIAGLRKHLARAQAQLASTRARLDERKRVAAERWSEIRALRAERTRLRRELDARG